MQDRLGNYTRLQVPLLCCPLFQQLGLLPLVWDFQSFLPRSESQLDFFVLSVYPKAITFHELEVPQALAMALNHLSIEFQTLVPESLE